MGRSGARTSTFAHRPFRRVAGLALAIAATQGALLPLTAQSRSAEDTRTVDGYRLTMPTLRKVEAAPNGVDPMTAVRETFTSFLTVPSLAATPLEPAQFRFAVPAS